MTDDYTDSYSLNSVYARRCISHNELNDGEAVKVSEERVHFLLL